MLKFKVKLNTILINKLLIFKDVKSYNLLELYYYSIVNTLPLFLYTFLVYTLIIYYYKSLLKFCYTIISI